MKELNQYREILRNLPEEIKEAEVQAEKTVLSEAVASEGKISGMGFSDKTELFVRASAEKTGMVYTENLSGDPKEVLMQALSNSQMGESAELMNTPASIEKAMGEINGLPTEEGDCREITTDELRRIALSLERELREGFPKADKLEVCVDQKLTTLGVVNSNGADISGTTGRYDVTVTTSHRENPLRVYEEAISVKTKEEIDSNHFLEGLKNWELTFQPEGKFVPGTYRAVLSSRTVNYLLVTGWQIFSAVKYQSERSVLCGKIGEKIFSDCVNIWDYKGSQNSRVPSGYSFLIDMEGTPCRDVPLVEQGVFKGLLHNLSTADRAGVISTGNAGRRALLNGSIHTDMTAIPGNFTMNGGEDTLEELFAKCGDGIYIYEAFDQFHGLDVVTGDFSFPCKGILIENGRLTAQVSGLSMNGNIVELFHEVEALGKEQKIEPMCMYHNYTVSGPAMLVSSLRVSG
jgi:PmbA protein